MSVPLWFTNPLAAGDSGRAVEVVRRKLGMIPGTFDAALTAAVRAFQRGARLPMTGYVDEDTARALGEREGFGLLPPWWEEDGDHRQHVERLLGSSDPDVLKRFQGNHHLPPTGIVDETTARLLYGLE